MLPRRSKGSNTEQFVDRLEKAGERRLPRPDQGAEGQQRQLPRAG